MLVKELIQEVGIVGGLVAGLTGITIFGWVKMWLNMYKLLKAASLATLHSQLYDKGAIYIKRGFVTLSELDDLEYTWTAYHGLGGNGTGEKIYEKVRELPIADYVSAHTNDSWQEVEEIAALHEAKRKA